MNARSVTAALVVALLLMSGCTGGGAAPITFQLELDGEVRAEDAFSVSIQEAGVPGVPQLIVLCGADDSGRPPCSGGATYTVAPKATRWKSIDYAFHRYHRGEAAETFKSGTVPNVFGTTITAKYIHRTEESP